MVQYADTEKPVSEIGRELGAQVILEGSVRRAGGRVRISAQLIDPDTRDYLCSEPRFEAIVEQLQGKRRRAREQMLEADVDLYPPGATSDPKREKS
jgi:TolB-like protein